METQWAFQCDDNGYYIGQSARQPSPLEPGVWLIPAGCVLVAPPVIPEGQRAKWDGAQWVLEDIPVPPAPPAPVAPDAGPTGPTGPSGPTGA